MKTRAECLEEYGSDYFVEKKIEEGELFKVGKESWMGRRLSVKVNVPVGIVGGPDRPFLLLS